MVSGRLPQLVSAMPVPRRKAETLIFFPSNRYSKPNSTCLTLCMIRPQCTVNIAAANFPLLVLILDVALSRRSGRKPSPSVNPQVKITKASVNAVIRMQFFATVLKSIRAGEMKTNRFTGSGNTFWLMSLLFPLAACSADSGNGPDCRYNEAWLSGQCRVDLTIEDFIIPDGIWRSEDSSGRDVVVFVNRVSGFQFVDGLGRQGAGIISIGEGSTVYSSFQLFTQQGESFADGSSVADCSFSGTIIERQALTMFESCLTSAGLQFEEELSLSFDPLYSQASSLERVAGLYETPTGNVLDIAPDGTIFAQDARSGCVTNGQVRTIVSFTNMYLYEYGIENCSGPDVIWNGTGFSGLAVLDDRMSPEVLEFAVLGEVKGTPVSVVSKNLRI